MNPEEKVFDHQVKIPPKTKLKGVRKAILEELGVQDMCTARLYYFTLDTLNPIREADAEEENKDGSAEKPNVTNGEELVGEMASLETLGIVNGTKLEVEVFFSIDVSVPGKGAGYN